MSSEPVELKLNLVAETTMAYGVTEDALDDPVIWLPKSQVELLGRKPELMGAIDLEIPEWLAIEKGLV